MTEGHFAAPVHYFTARCLSSPAWQFVSYFEFVLQPNALLPTAVFDSGVPVHGALVAIRRLPRASRVYQRFPMRKSLWK